MACLPCHGQDTSMFCFRGGESFDLRTNYVCTQTQRLGRVRDDSLSPRRLKKKQGNMLPSMSAVLQLWKQQRYKSPEDVTHIPPTSKHTILISPSPVKINSRCDSQTPLKRLYNRHPSSASEIWRVLTSPFG